VYLVFSTETGHRCTQDFTVEGVLVVGAVRGSGVQGQNPGKGLGNENPQKLKQNVKLVYNFYVFPFKI